MAYLAQQRLVLRHAAYGLTDEQARATPTVSPHSIGGLIKHVATAEQVWMDTVQRIDREWSPEKHEASFRLSADETLASVLALYDQAAKNTDEIIDKVSDVGQSVPVPVSRWVAWLPTDVEAWSVRWVLLHLITETARHAGHADIIRESLDGATARPLMAAAEDWPPNRGVKPWKAPEQRTSEA
jgi:uncharacterized damage-inducible protein DinB